MIFDAKAYLIDVIKDSPILIYVAFYQPLHDWLIVIAEQWNPILQLILNLLALFYAIHRFIPIYRAWRLKEKHSNLK